jgi:hypothetical protein
MAAEFRRIGVCSSTLERGPALGFGVTEKLAHLVEGAVAGAFAAIVVGQEIVERAPRDRGLPLGHLLGEGLIGPIVVEPDEVEREILRQHV